MTQLFRVLYCSRNLLPNDAGSVATHVRSILEISRRNNSRHGLTGGLLFSAGCFAQVLEGPPDAVESTFERIQCDDRHSDVTVLQTGIITARDFPGWSMAFSGIGSDAPLANLALEAAFQGQSEGGSDILTMLRGVVQREDERCGPVWTANFPAHAQPAR